MVFNDITITKFIEEIRTIREKIQCVSQPSQIDGGWMAQ